MNIIFNFFCKKKTIDYSIFIKKSNTLKNRKQIKSTLQKQSIFSLLHFNFLLYSIIQKNICYRIDPQMVQYRTWLQCQVYFQVLQQRNTWFFFFDWNEKLSKDKLLFYKMRFSMPIDQICAIKYLRLLRKTCWQ